MCSYPYRNIQNLTNLSSHIYILYHSFLKLLLVATLSIYNNSYFTLSYFFLMFTPNVPFFWLQFYICFPLFPRFFTLDHLLPCFWLTVITLHWFEKERLSPQTAGLHGSIGKSGIASSDLRLGRRWGVWPIGNVFAWCFQSYLDLCEHLFCY